MEQLLQFYLEYGWQLALIAILGIFILGILKYANVFEKIAKDKRKPIYLSISVGFSFGATVVYLLIIGQMDMDYLLTVTGSIFGLNQLFYSIFENTKLRDLWIGLVDKVFAYIKEKLKKKVEDDG